MVRGFPPGTPLAVVAPRACGFGEILAERGDGAATFIELPQNDLPQHPSLASTDNVILEGLDSVPEPRELLRHLSRTSSRARLFVLVANASFARGLDAFYRGAHLAAEHPLVRDEVRQLLEESGWSAVAINPVFDNSLPEKTPAKLELPAVQFEIADHAVLERVRAQAFVAIADPI